jgi:hypothetical protein
MFIPPRWSSKPISPPSAIAVMSLPTPIAPPSIVDPYKGVRMAFWICLFGRPSGPPFA